jgi:hypothetical protein
MMTCWCEVLEMPLCECFVSAASGAFLSLLPSFLGAGSCFLGAEALCRRFARPWGFLFRALNQCTEISTDGLGAEFCWRMGHRAMFIVPGRCKGVGHLLHAVQPDVYRLKRRDVHMLCIVPPPTSLRRQVACAMRS